MEVYKLPDDPSQEHCPGCKQARTGRGLGYRAHTCRLRTVGQIASEERRRVLERISRRSR